MEKDFELSQIKTALIVGGGHGIGLAIAQELLRQYPKLKLWITYNNPDKATPLMNWINQSTPPPQTHSLNIKDSQSIDEFAKQLKVELAGEKLDLCLIATGFLHTTDFMPEKSLKEINAEHLLEYFQVNSITTALFAKALKPLFSTQTPSCFAAISAKVGSISDNTLGGWYGYRASKAALNMFIKNISIEFKQSQLKTIVLSIHPGTTHTDLSKPFLAHIKHQVFTPAETAQHILEVIDCCPFASSGLFKNWDGSDLPW